MPPNEHALATPDKPAVIMASTGTVQTYAELEARANQVAHALSDLGIGAGDHVGIYAYNSIEWAEILWAAFKIRAVWININYRYLDNELAYLIENADVEALVFHSSLADRVARVIPKVRAWSRTSSSASASRAPMPKPLALHSRRIRTTCTPC